MGIPANNGTFFSYSSLKAASEVKLCITVFIPVSKLATTLAVIGVFVALYFVATVLDRLFNTPAA